MKRIGTLLLALLLAGCGGDTNASTQGDKPPAARYAAVARGKVDIEGGVIRLAAQREGVVQQVLVEEGDRVQRGQVLAIVDTSLAVITVRVAEAELAQAEAQIPLLQARLGAAERQLARQRVAAAGQAISRQALDEAETNRAVIAAELRAAEAAVTTTRHRLEETRYEIEARTVRAPLDGRIVRRAAKPGDGVSTQTVTELFQLVPDAQRIVRAELEEQFVDAVKPGMPAEIAIETSTGATVRGSVQRIGEVFGQRKSGDDPNERVDVRVVECVIALEAGETPLRIGQRVLVRIGAPRTS